MNIRTTTALLSLAAVSILGLAACDNNGANSGSRDSTNGSATPRSTTGGTPARNTPGADSNAGSSTGQSGTSSGAANRTGTTGSGTTGAATNEAPKADNTERNKADRDMDTSKTPMDQSNSDSDVKITADIRRAIMDESGMSVNAQNCKIITQNGVVTLRGPVATQAEKDSIEAKARAAAGVTNVVNELEVKAN